MVIQFQINDGLKTKTRTYEKIYRGAGLAELEEQFFNHRAYSKWGCMIQLKGKDRILLHSFGKVPEDVKVNGLIIGKPEVKIELPLREIHDQASALLADIKSLFPPQYKITMVARNTTLDNADLVLTEDQDMDAVKKAIDTSTVKGPRG